MAAQSQQLCHGSSSISAGSEDDSETLQLTVALLPSPGTQSISILFLFYCRISLCRVLLLVTFYISSL